jgi:signal transduction histidine kinase
LRLRLRLLVLVPALLTMVILCAAAAVATTAPVAVNGWIIAVVAVAVALIVLAFANWLAVRTAADLHRQRSEYSESVNGWLRHFQSGVEEGRRSISDALEQLDRGERPSPPDISAVQTNTDDNPWHEAEAALSQLHAEAWRAVVNGRQAELTQALVYLAGGLTLLLVRALGIVTELTKQVQDPDVLYRVFDVNNLLKRMRRSAGRLAVLGGVKARSLTQPIGLMDLLRGASGEIERYARVRMHTAALEVQIPGFAGPDLIHLLAELEENATLSSPPDTKVVVRATKVTAGLAVEIEDRGVGMARRELDRYNRMLANPQDTHLAEQLAQRQTGLLVVAKLARRYGIDVRLQKNLMHGITALVVVPNRLLLWQNEPAALSPTHADAAAVPGPAPHAATGPGPRPAGGPRPSPPLPAPTGQLPHRDAQPIAPQRLAVSGPPAAAPALGAAPDTRPRLPQRIPQATTREPAAPAQPESSPAPQAPPNPAFFSNFTQGVQRAEDGGTAGEVRPPEGSAS